MFNGTTTSLVLLESRTSDPTIRWTELLVARDPPSATAAFFAIFLLSFAQVASLLASLLYSAADKAPLSSAVVRTPLRYFDTARSLGYTFKSNFFQPRNQPRIHYLSEGSSSSPRVLLLLHGEPFWSQAWQKVIPALSQHSRVVVPDLVGFGLSDKWVDWRQYTLARHATSLLQLVDQLHLPSDREVVLVGHNWGWMVGAEMARRRPNLFSKLVILNTNNLPDGEALLERFSSTSTWLQFQVINSWFLAFRAAMDLLRQSFPLNLLIYSLNSGYSKRELEAFLSPWPEKKHRGGTTSFPLLVPVYPSHPEAPTMSAIRTFLATWNRPTLVLYSGSALLPFIQSGDFVVGNRPHFYDSLIPGVSRLRRVPGSGHLVMWDQPALVFKEIQTFIDS